MLEGQYDADMILTALLNAGVHISQTFRIQTYNTIPVISLHLIQFIWRGFSAQAI